MDLAHLAKSTYNHLPRWILVEPKSTYNPPNQMQVICKVCITYNSMSFDMKGLNLHAAAAFVGVEWQAAAGVVSVRLGQKRPWSEWSVVVRGVVGYWCGGSTDMGNLSHVQELRLFQLIFANGGGMRFEEFGMCWVFGIRQRW